MPIYEHRFPAIAATAAENRRAARAAEKQRWQRSL